MTIETLERVLSEAPLPDADEARERTVASARARVRSRQGAGRPTRRWRRPALQLAAAAIALACLLLTPPGRAAADWLGGVVGIGDVGGSPTNEHRGFPATGAAIVINNGFAPDGSRYEWVAYPCKIDLRKEGLPERFEGFGVSFEWPGSAQDGGAGGGSCAEGEGDASERAGHYFGSFGTQIVPSQFKGVAAPDLVVSGETTPSVHEVRVVYTDARGGRHSRPVDFERIGRKLRGKITASRELGGTFVAFIPGAWAARDDLENRLDLRALQGTGKLEAGPLVRRDRSRIRAAQSRCAPLQPDLGTITINPNEPPDTKEQERLFAPYRRCMEQHMPRGPVQVIAYDENGRELGREAEPLFVTSKPGQPPDMPRLSERPVDPDAAGEPIVLATGRAPDGAAYEFYTERFENDDGKVYGTCTEQWWPKAGQPGPGSCGPGLPPSTAYGRREPEQIFARAYGFVQPARPATRYLMVSGYARPNVSRVGVAFEARDGRTSEVPVELTQVDRALGERMGADGPFGFFVAFVPARAEHRPIAVSAYDSSGNRLSTDKRTLDP